MEPDTNLALQQSHPLRPTTGFGTVEELVNYLIHLRAYEEVGRMAAGKSILDWGCNNGYGMEVMRQFGCARLSGVDVSAPALEEARQRLGETVELVLYCGESSPFPAESFDIVTSFQCIEHVADHNPYLSEIWRVLKPGGMAVLTTPNAVIRLDPGMQPWNEFHVREFTASELQELLSGYFKSVEVRGLFGSPPVHAIEMNRCQAARERARSGESEKQKSRTLLQIIRRWLPDPLVPILRRFQPTKRRPRLPNYTTADLYYQEINLDAALDLMAVCNK